MAFCVPYDDCGVRAVDSGTIVRQVAAVDRAAAGKHHARPVAARAGRPRAACRVLSKLTRIPRSKSASAWPLTTAAR